MRTCREHKGNIDSEPLVVGRGPCVRRWATGRAGALGQVADKAAGGPGQGFQGAGVQPWSPGGSGPETCAHALQEPGEGQELLQDGSGRGKSPAVESWGLRPGDLCSHPRGAGGELLPDSSESPAAGGQAQGLLDKTEAGDTGRGALVPSVLWSAETDSRSSRASPGLWRPVEAGVLWEGQPRCLA